MNDYCDGKVFKEHPLFTTHKNSLQINLYFDELEVCNPLGSKAKIHKLGKRILNLTHFFILLLQANQQSLIYICIYCTLHTYMQEFSTSR